VLRPRIVSVSFTNFIIAAPIALARRREIG